MNQPPKFDNIFVILDKLLKLNNINISNRARSAKDNFFLFIRFFVLFFVTVKCVRQIISPDSEVPAILTNIILFIIILNAYFRQVSLIVNIKHEISSVEWLRSIYEKCNVQVVDDISETVLRETNRWTILFIW